MSCGVMYQSHYSYFPYHRNILPHNHHAHHNKDITEHDLQGREAGGEGGGVARGSPLPYSTFPASQTTPPHHNTPPASSYTSQTMVSQPPSTFPGHRGDSDGDYRGDEERGGEQELGEGGQRLPPPCPTDNSTLGKVKGEKDKEEEGSVQRSAQYLSANCVIFTYYSGDITNAVDAHFSKALSQSSEREHVPLSARNLPPSFWDSNWIPPPSSLPHHSATDLYSEYSDPWQSYMASMTGYSAHQMYTARSYSSLLLQSRREWVEQNYPASPYSGMSGLEGGMQNGAKDLYWF